MSTRVLSRWLSISIVCLVGCILAAPGFADEPAAENSAEPTGPTTVFLVRHAEKVRGPAAGDDPALTEAGLHRSRALAQTLSQAGIDAIYTTQWRRTVETGAKLAEALNLEPKVIRTDSDFIEKMRELLLEEKARRIVVVGHSDTTPALARALGADQAPDIADDDFDDLYQIVVSDEGTRFIHLRYGHPTP